ncbi:MAG: cobalamin B12-binding domain-containing protein [Ramlibacter sp.]|nr:cobalamin B12-binding domain-containing protein [Ramlibacter sp.]
MRVLLGKLGLDGHDRGIKILAEALKDAGMEVIYTGLHQRVAQVANTAIQEDVDVVGVSILSGAHMTLVPELMQELRARGAGDKRVVAGGFIPEAEDRRTLEELGAAHVFEQDVPLAETVRIISALGARK